MSQLHKISLPVLLLLGPWGTTMGACSPTLQARSSQQERERERNVARQQFTKNFHDLQVVSQALLREHEAGKLTAARLGKDLKTINKSAKALRTLTALGDLAKEPPEIDKEIDTPQKFDQAIRRLAKLIYDFAHNPVHQNNKVFNTVEAARAQTDLLTITNLSKAMESNAKAYSFAGELR